MEIEQITKLIQTEIEKSQATGTPLVPLHRHDGTDNLSIPTTSILGYPIYSVRTATSTPINADGTTVVAQAGTLRFQYDGTNLGAWIMNGQTWKQINPASAATTPGGSNGDVQINASGAFGTIGGLQLDQTGNTRGTFSLDIQTKRGAVTQVASGTYSVSIGSYATASGNFSTALGLYGTASGLHSTSVGAFTSATAKDTSAFGYKSAATGAYGLAVGYKAAASGSYGSHAVGNNSIASNYGANAFGQACHATGSGSVAIGKSVTASGNYSIAIGYNFTNSTASTLMVGYASGSVRIDANQNIGINGLSAGGGYGVVFVKNGTAPVSNPTNGGIIYTTGGALYYRGSAGTVTPLAAA